MNKREKAIKILEGLGILVASHRLWVRPDPVAKGRHTILLKGGKEDVTLTFLMEVAATFDTLDIKFDGDELYITGATLDPPRTQDGRSITSVATKRVDMDIDNVVAWVEDLAAQYDKDVEEFVARKAYADAAVAADVAATLRGHVFKEARRGTFLPPSMRPCINGAGNRGSHLEYVSRKGAGDLVCAFCGRH
jgi:hypothetical protein